MSHTSKRPLYFISGDDFYFIAYSILLILAHLGGAKNRVSDHRKIAYLAQFINDERLIGILERTKGKSVINSIDRELLFISYTTAELHKGEVLKILLSLERKGLVVLARTDSATVIDVSLKVDVLPPGFLDSANFSHERLNAERLKSVIKRLSVLSFETLLQRLYTDQGIKVWAT